jgi:hypothetical protein
MEHDPFDLLDDKPPRTVMDDIESNTRSIDEQAGGIRFELEGMSASLDRRLADIKATMDWHYGFLSNINDQMRQLRIAMWCIAALLALIAIQLAT